MWLLDVHTMNLVLFNDNRKAVEAGYAILSHTWGDEELLFQDMRRGRPVDYIKLVDPTNRYNMMVLALSVCISTVLGMRIPDTAIGASDLQLASSSIVVGLLIAYCLRRRQTSGFAKVQNACARAKLDGYKYIWIDTCCIDKESSAELSEAINSMYQWYADARVCYAYLADCDINQRGSDFVTPSGFPSRWFARGWTLQELIAPKTVNFFDVRWQRIGSRSDSPQQLSKLTGIDEEVLRHQKAPRSCSVATRMSWAAYRQTTRVEDEAYSLFGIFDVNMPMIYGEGRRAFLRLQEEIVRASTDHSLFAWPYFPYHPSNTNDTDKALFALGPEFFAGLSLIRTTADFGVDDSFTLSNVGLHISLPVIHREDCSLAVLNCDTISGFALPLKLRRFEHRGGDNASRTLVCAVIRDGSMQVIDHTELWEDGALITDLILLR